MLERYLNVLLVDDEPDVLAVSKLALRRLRLYGLPLRLHTAASRGEAEAFLKTHPEGRHLALAIIDVVMETDDAGLELCRWIREELGDRLLPLIVRTGQPGKAPEREVIDRYEISGYVNKIEATETRLYSIVKAAARQHLTASYDHAVSELLYHLITHMQSPARFRGAAAAGLRALTRSTTDTPVESVHADHAIVNERFYVGTGDLEDPARALSLIAQLAATPSTPVGITGDAVHVGDGRMMIHIASTDAFPEPLHSIWTIGAPPQPFVQRALYRVTKQFQVLMHHVAR